MYPTNMQSNRRYDINIKPSSTDTIPAVLIVDSSQRNRSVYENSGHYTFELINSYKDVISLELIQANIPNSFYSINSNNNVISLDFDNNNDDVVETTLITIPKGTYTTAVLLATAITNAINLALNRVSGLAADRKFLVEHNATLNKYVITGPDDTAAGVAHTTPEFVLTPGVTYGADIIIGLNSSATNSTSAGGSATPLTLPNSHMIHPFRYLVLEIRGMERCDGNSNTLLNSFCVIPIDTTANNSGLVKDGDTIDNDTYVYHFPEPVPCLSNMEITIRTPDGNICDFNGCDHFMVFEIICLSRPSKYT